MDITNTTNIINPMNNIDPLEQLNLSLNQIINYPEIIVYNESTKIEKVEELDDVEFREILQYYLEQDKIQEENDAILATEHLYEITHCRNCHCEIVPQSIVCSKECDKELREDDFIYRYRS
jgi:hypothetical protein